MTDEELSYEQRVAIERIAFRHQMLMTAARPEQYRWDLVKGHFRQNIFATYLRLPLEECLEVVFGKDGYKRYWKGVIDLPMKFWDCVQLLSLTAAPDPDHLQPYAMRLSSILLLAFQSGEKFFIGGNSEILMQISYGWQVPRDNQPKIRVGEAAIWLLEKSTLAFLVPESLAKFLHPPTETTDLNAEASKQSIYNEAVRLLKSGTVRSGRGRGSAIVVLLREKFPDCKPETLRRYAQPALTEHKRSKSD
ncbi:MAG TPA: hypothetical protein VHY35_02035 [Stellaceae bacterium]|jgi:hypothetical protein|nr:hypothetical protein [Stellaceae bacterium]